MNTKAGGRRPRAFLTLTLAAQMYTVLLLIASNTFMTLAWYGHLRYKEKPLYLVILVSWLIAFPEYALQVPANRLGSKTFTVTQLKILQEVISVGVFVVFAWLYFKEPPTWRTGVAFLLIVIAVGIVRGDPGPAPQAQPQPDQTTQPMSGS